MRFLVGLLLLAACTEPAHRFLELPPRSTEVRSVLVVLEWSKASEVLAFESTAAIQVDAASEGLERITVLHYASDLAANGLTPGPLALADEGTCGRRPLPEPDQIFDTDLSTGRFAPASAWSKEVAGLRREVPCPCVTFHVEQQVSIGPDSEVYSILPINEHRVIVGTDRRFLEVELDGRVTASSTAVVAKADGFRAADGQLWYGNRGPALVTGRGVADLRVIPFPQEVDSFRWISGPLDPADPFELFVLTLDGDRVLHYDGTRLETLWTTPAPGGPQVGSVAWFAPNQAQVAQEDGVGMLRFRNGMPSTAEWPRDQGVMARLAYLGPPYGLLASTRIARIWAHGETAFEELPQRTTAPLEAEMFSFAPFRGGFISGGANGNVVQHHPDADFCPVQRLGGPRRLTSIAVLGDRVVVGGIYVRPEDLAIPNQVLILSGR